MYIKRKLQETREFVQGVEGSLLNESHTDCALVSSEGICIFVHKIVLSPCTILKKILLDNSCCKGRCSNNSCCNGRCSNNSCCNGRCSKQSVIFPDVPYEHLKVCVDFLYRGEIQCDRKNHDTIRKILVDVLGIRKTIDTFETIDGGVHCTNCHAYIDVINLGKHMLSSHIRIPALRDLRDIAKGDNSRVSCSYANGPCDLDSDVTRLRNGFFNYMGQEDPSLCVKEHYVEVHLKNVLDHLAQTPGIHVDEETILQFKNDLMKSEGNEKIQDSDSDDDDNDYDSINTIESMCIEEIPSEDNPGTNGDYSNTIELPTIDMPSTIEVPQNTDCNPFTTPLSLNNVENAPCETADADKGSKTNMPLRDVCLYAGKDVKKRKCLKCNEMVRDKCFTRHLVTHFYHLWPEGSEGVMKCPMTGCKDREELKTRKKYIIHLGTFHGQLKDKLKAENQTMSDFEMEISDDEAESEQAIIDSIRTTNKLEMLQDNAMEEEPTEEDEPPASIDDILGNPKGDEDNQHSSDNETEPFDDEEKDGRDEIVRE